MLTQNDPLRDFDTWLDRFAGRGAGGYTAMPMDAYRRGNDLWVHVDLPGVSSDDVDINVERRVLTITAQRQWQREEGDQLYLTERHRGHYRRQVHLGDGLDTENVEAQYDNGVLTLRIPVAERAQPRKIQISNPAHAIATSSEAES